MCWSRVTQETGRGRKEGSACAVKAINTCKASQDNDRHKEKVLVGALVRKWPVVWARESGGDRKERALAWYGSGCCLCGHRLGCGRMSPGLLIAVARYFRVH